MGGMGRIAPRGGERSVFWDWPSTARGATGMPGGCAPAPTAADTRRAASAAVPARAGSSLMGLRRLLGEGIRVVHVERRSPRVGAPSELRDTGLIAAGRGPHQLRLEGALAVGVPFERPAGIRAAALEAPVAVAV